SRNTQYVIRIMGALMRLANKVAIVTGAGAGIGRASAVRFGKEGARVVCADLEPVTGEETVRLLRDAGGEGRFVRGDASAASDVERLVREAVERYGRLDVFYANAGIVPGGTVLEGTDEEWDGTMAINARSVYLACKYAI